MPGLSVLAMLFYYLSSTQLIYSLVAEDLRDAENLLDWREQRENQRTTFLPVLARAGDQHRKTVPRPPECEAAMRLVTAVGSAMSQTWQTGDPV